MQHYPGKKAIFKLIFGTFLAILMFSCPKQPQASASSLEILIPLYSYPNWYDPDNYLWQKVVSAAERVPITAVINPHNGPNNAPPNSDYLRGLNDLRAAGITLLGYVYTQYGDRSLAEVTADIDLYDRYYGVDGIFVDEAASNQTQLNYYQQLYRYIKGKANLDLVVLNQGTHADEAYLSQPATDIAIIFENYSQPWQEYQPQPYLQSYGAKRFACLIHSVTDINLMKSHIDRAVERNIGYIYITDDSPDHQDRDPWNSLPSYWEEEVNYLQSLPN